MERAATTDELSQLVNRRGFQAILESNLRHGPSLQQQLVLAIIDVDRFKDINDTMGHESGDQAIQFVAHQLTEHFPTAICVSRLGGDEFGVLLLNDELTKAEAVFEDFRRDLQATSQTSFPVRITVSIGVATSHPSSASARELLETAHRAMYLSKNAGRNRVTMLKV